MWCAATCKTLFTSTYTWSNDASLLGSSLYALLISCNDDDDDDEEEVKLLLLLLLLLLFFFFL